MSTEWVYVLTFDGAPENREGHRAHKIGKSANPFNRIRTIQTAHPSIVYPRALFEAPNSVAEERLPARSRRR